jgi:diadenosine tetraphosphate (Ap4A) HIT family hydrolase
MEDIKMIDNNCAYCAEGELVEKFGIKICELQDTKVYLFKEQSHKGRVIVASKYHVSEMVDLTPEQRNAFFADVNHVSEAIHKAFSPDKVNYGAYGDTGHHLHFHLVPKYKNDEFEWGGTFAMDPKRKTLTDAEYDEIIAELKKYL